MIEIVRTQSNNPDFTQLVKQLDNYLAEVDGEDHAFYDQYNGVQDIKHVIVAYEERIPIACGTIKEYSEKIVEVKRMFTLPQARGKGIASALLQELEKWAIELGYEKCMLETGKRQIEAIHLYEKNKYERIENFGPYKNVDGSVCFVKTIKPIF